MKINHPRILMNEEGASPGGGAAPPAPPPPPAQNAAPQEPTIPVAQLKSVIAETFGELRNGLFADLRKAGALGKDKPTENGNAAPTPTQTPSAPTAAAGLSMADVEAMLERERVITARATKHELTDAQIRRMKSALSGVAVETFATEADAYLTDMGLVRVKPEPPTTTTTIPTVPQTRPASDKGSPAPPSGVLDYERELAENAIGMSPAAYQMLVAKHGAAKAWQMRSEAARAQAERIKVDPKR